MLRSRIEESEPLDSACANGWFHNYKSFGNNKRSLSTIADKEGSISD